MMSLHYWCSCLTLPDFPNMASRQPCAPSSNPYSGTPVLQYLVTQLEGGRYTRVP
jgi:hypothetical protein